MSDVVKVGQNGVVSPFGAIDRRVIAAPSLNHVATPGRGRRARRPDVDYDAVFQPLFSAVIASAPEVLPKAQARLLELKAEIARGEAADDRRIAKLLDGLVSLVPASADAAVKVFGSPQLNAVVGAATASVLEKLDAH